MSEARFVIEVSASEHTAWTGPKSAPRAPVRNLKLSASLRHVTATALLAVSLGGAQGCAKKVEESVSQDHGSAIIKEEDLAYIACVDARDRAEVSDEIARVLQKEGITVVAEGDVVWCIEVLQRDAVRAKRVLESHPELKARGMKVVYAKELK